MPARSFSLKLDLEDRILLAGVVAVQTVLRVFPPASVLAAAKFLGRFVAATSKRRHLALKHLKIVFRGEKSTAELSSIAMRAYENVAMSIVEMLMAPYWSDAYWKSHIEVSGKSIIDNYLEQKKGVIVLSGHFGNWEAVPLVGCLNGYDPYVLARKQKHPRLDKHLSRLRGHRGARIVQRGMGTRELIRSLKEGGIVGILADQDGGKNGLRARLFGRQVSCSRGAARFAALSDAKIIPAFAVRLSGGYHRIWAGEEIQLLQGVSEEETERDVMSKFCAQLQAEIRKTPDQWLWPYNRWKSSPQRHCMILEDGKAGHMRQSWTVYEALVRTGGARSVPADRELSCSHVQVNYRSTLRKKILMGWGMLTRGWYPFRRAWLRWALSEETFRAIDEDYADIVLSCGSSTEAVNVIVSGLNRAKSCFLQKPQFAENRFDIVVAPLHDGNHAPSHRLMSVGALSQLPPVNIGEFTKRFVLPAGPFLGVLLGGESRGTQWNHEAIERMLKGCLDFAEANGLKILCTTSRRTDAQTEVLVKKVLADRKRCPLVVLAGENNPEGAYAGILASAATFVVTGESVSMISEAAATGKPIVVFDFLPAGGFPAKIKRFNATLGSHRQFQFADPSSLHQALTAAFSRETGTEPHNAVILRSTAEALLS